VGPRISAADLVYFPTLQSLRRADSKPAARAFRLGFLELESHYPALARWETRIRDLPGYEHTYPPHWRAG
jgi:glutathione S-transferase